MNDTINGLKILDRMPIPREVSSSKIRFRGEAGDIPLSEKVLSKHILFTGSIGTGKTNAMFGLLDSIITNMTNRDVMIVFDAKGDFKKKFYRPGKDKFISATDSGSEIWNLFKEIKIDGLAKYDVNLRELVNSFFEDKIKKSHSPFFPMAARDVFMGIIAYIIKKIPTNLHNNEELAAFLDNASIQEVIDRFEDTDGLTNLVDYLAGPEGITEQTQGVYSELRTVANELFINNFRKKGEFSIRNFTRSKGGRILFIEYDMSIGSVLTPIYRTMFDLALKETLGRSTSEGNVYFVADEISLLPRLYHISDGINLGRSLGVKFIVACQNCHQLVEAYGEHVAYSILSGFGTLVSFRNVDKMTTDFIKSHYGTKQERVDYHAVNYRGGVRDNFNVANVIEDWDLLSLRVESGDAFVSVSDYSPCPVRYRFKFMGV